MARVHSVCSSRVGRSPQMPIYDTSLGKTLYKPYPRNLPIPSCWLVQGSMNMCKKPNSKSARTICGFITSTDTKRRRGRNTRTTFCKTLRRKDRGYLGRETLNIVFRGPKCQRCPQRTRVFPAVRVRRIVVEPQCKSWSKSGVHVFLNFTLSAFTCSLIHVDSLSTGSNSLFLRWILCSTSRKRNS